MTEPDANARLAIKKYSNRRFYDTTRSCHVTLRELHDLICQGYEIQITDGKNGEDITNVVLTQIILDRDPPKLSMFPTSVLHQVIRTQQEFLGSVVEQFFAQVLETHKASHEQWQRFLRNTLGVAPLLPVNPLEWTRSMMASLGPTLQPKGPTKPEKTEGHDQELEALRRQVEELTRQVRRMSRAPGEPSDATD